jgi:hypothetical protein
MAERVFRVNTVDRLMLRSQPDREASVLARLEPGQVVARLDEEDRDGWYWAFADVPGDGAYVGYVAGRHLAVMNGQPVAPTMPAAPGPATPAPVAPPAERGSALPASAFVQKLIAFCRAEWEFFARGGIKESDEPARSRIRTYWQALGIHDRDGASRYAWSAAFISFAMKEAGAGARFLYSASHCTYINKSIRDKDRPGAAFVGLPADGYAPQVGDLIARARPTSDAPARATYDTALSLGYYTSHTDIVTDVGGGVVTAIGGNVGNSVSRSTLALSPDGTISPAALRREKVFAIMRNQIIEPA